MENKKKNVRQVYSPLDIALLVAILAVGIAFSQMENGWSGVGYSAIFVFVCMVPFWQHGYRVPGQRGLFSKKEIMVARECKDSVLAFLEGRADTLEYNPQMNGGALVNIYTRKRDGLILAGYFDYADFAVGIEYQLCEISPEKKARLEAIETKTKL